MEENTKIMDEGKTDSPHDETELQNTETESNDKTQDPAGQDTSGKSKIRSILAAAGGFIAGGGISYLAMDTIPVAETQAQSTDLQNLNRKPVTEPVVYEEAPIATKITDEMNFNEAFATARQELGAGGVFEWKGNAYNTYYLEEWDAMTDDQKTEFIASLDYSEKPSGYDDAYADQSQPDPAPIPVDVSEGHNVQPEQEPVPQEPILVDREPINPVFVDQSTDSVIQEPVETLQPEVIDIEFDVSGNAIVSVDLDGDDLYDVVMVDTNADDILDVVAVDLDHNGVPDEEPVRIDEYEITVEEVRDEMIASEHDLTPYASKDDINEIPDYMNDADVSEF